MCLLEKNGSGCLCVSEKAEQQLRSSGTFCWDRQKMGTGKERVTGVYAPSFFYIGGKKVL